MISHKLLTRRQFLAFLPAVPMAILGNNKPSQSTRYNPKFNIGDYVECQFPDAEDSTWYERGEITVISLDVDGNWDYRYIIRECPRPGWFGVIGEAYEKDLILLSRAN